MILKNVRILSEGKLVSRDIEVRDGVYSRIEEHIEENGQDMKGLYLAKGLCDIHVHFREPGFTHKETIRTGSLAAAKGGFTTVFTMPNLNPVPDTLEHLEVEEEIIRKDALIQVIPYGSVTMGEKGNEVSDIVSLSSKTRCFSDDGVGFHDYDVLRKALRIIKDKHLFIASHAEDPVLLTKREGEYLAVDREIRIAEEIQVPYHFCHMSTKESFEEIRNAQRKGLPITCEVTPHHLFLNETDIKNTNFKMNPPLRTIEDQKETLKALLDGTATVIATDHAPHSKEEKSREYTKAPNGIIGLETSFPLVYTHLVKKNLATLPMVEKWMSDNPRRLTGLEPYEIKVGKEANFALFDLEHERTYKEDEILSIGKNSPFIGNSLYGFCHMTVYQGRIVYQNSED